VAPQGVASSQNQRALNILNVANIPGVALSNGLLSLPPGEYEVDGYAQSYEYLSSQLGVYDYTNNTWLALGLSVITTAGQLAQSALTSIVSGEFALSASANIGLAHYIGPLYLQAVTEESLGHPAGSGQPEVYAQLRVKKI
jgi:hypothetical protein